MSNYVQDTNFAAKDALPPNTAAKRIKGTEIYDEYGLVATAIASKVDKTGATMTGNLDFGDEVRVRLGNDSDLQVYHTGTNSYIEDTGTGGLVIAGAATLTLMQATQGQNADKYIECTANEAVDLYYDNSKKLETTTAGVTVTGELVATTINGGTF